MLDAYVDTFHPTVDMNGESGVRHRHTRLWISPVLHWLLLAWAGAATAASSMPTDSVFFDAFEGTLQTIDVACGSGALAGNPVSCIATGTFASGAQIDISSDVDWSSSDETVASVIDANGDLLAVNPGQSTITATRGVVQGSTVLTVAGAFTVQSTQPADSATNVPTPQNLVIAFTAAVNPATLTAQTVSGPCGGSVQMSANGFASCLAFATASANMSSGNTLATFTPAPAWSFGTLYQIKVTAAVQSAEGNPLGSEYVTANGFTTGIDTLCSTSCSVNETGDPAEADYCNLQFPLNLSVQTGASTGTIYARVYESGVTGGGSANPNVIAQIGYGPATANPENQNGWVWSTATYNVSIGNDDEYQAALLAPATGTYFFGSRFSFDGIHWTYCDGAVGDFGAGSNPGLMFQTDNLPVMTVTP